MSSAALNESACHEDVACSRAAAVAYFVAIMVKLPKQTRIKNKR